MHWDVGGVRVTKVLEREMTVPLDGLLGRGAADVAGRHGWLAAFAADGHAPLSMHGLVVDTGERTILVDTCVGHLREGMVFPPRPSPFLDNLAAAGYPPDAVDTVVCTHLHFDHVGGNTRLVDGAWVPAFPNARYLFGRVEWAHWSTTTGGFVNVDETVRPIVEAGRADLVETDHEVCPEVRLLPTPGHTPGHVSVAVESRGRRAVITGDLAHHPVQLADPDAGIRADSDPARAAATRRRFLAEREDDGALVIGTHFGGPTAGRVVRDGRGWRLDP